MAVNIPVRAEAIVALVVTPLLSWCDGVVSSESAVFARGILLGKNARISIQTAAMQVLQQLSLQPPLQLQLPRLRLNS